MWPRSKPARTWSGEINRIRWQKTVVATTMVRKEKISSLLEDSLNGDNFRAYVRSRVINFAELQVGASHPASCSGILNHIMGMSVIILECF